MGIKYRYALNNEAQLVDVSDISPDRRREGGPFSCIACGTAMVPHLGKSRRKHFSHRVEIACPEETYLHRAAKLAFADAYRQALAEGRPFQLTRTVDAECNHFAETFGFVCSGHVVESHDLTRFFDRVSVEEVIGDFRADVLLSSSRSGHVILVEFAVHHPCEPEKIAGGFRIIEFDIQSESDVEALRKPEIKAGGEQRVALYNFVDTVRKRSVCGGRCRRTIGVFLVHASGRSVVAEAKPQEVLEGRIGPSAVHREVVGLLPEGIDRMELYRRKVREAHFAGVPIRNCFLCRYHGLDGIEHAIFCKLHKQSWQSNTAVECEAYRPLGTPGECARVDAANDAYVKQNRARRFRWYTWNI